MTAASPDQPIRFEPEEAAPPGIALLVGFQGAALVLAPTVLNVAIAIRASGLDDGWLSWSVFAAMLICASITAFQAIQLRRFGAGHVVLAWPAAMFIAIMVASIEAAGPATFASLLVVCSLVQIGLAWWLPTLRRIVTPVVSGTVTMLIAVSVLPIAFDSVQDLPAGAPTSAGPVIAVATLLVSVIVTLRARGRWRLVAPFISIIAGCAVAAAFGVLDGDRIADAAWFGFPDVPSVGLDFTPGKEFWALLPSFAILTLVLGLKTISDGVVIQQGSRRRPKAIDFRQIQGMVSVNGIGMFFAGLCGTLPTMANSSYSLSLISLTGVAARRVGVGVALLRAVAHALTRPCARPPAPRRQLVPALGAPQVRELPARPHRAGLQEREVLLLRLPVAPEARPGRLRRPPPQRAPLRAGRRRPAPRERPHRVQHPRPRAPRRRGDGRCRQ